MHIDNVDDDDDNEAVLAPPSLLGHDHHIPDPSFPRSPRGPALMLRDNDPNRIARVLAYCGGGLVQYASPWHHGTISEHDATNG